MPDFFIQMTPDQFVTVIKIMVLVVAGIFSLGFAALLFAVQRYSWNIIPSLFGVGMLVAGIVFVFAGIRTF